MSALKKIFASIIISGCIAYSFTIKMDDSTSVEFSFDQTSIKTYNTDDPPPPPPDWPFPNSPYPTDSTRLFN